MKGNYYKDRGKNLKFKNKIFLHRVFSNKNNSIWKDINLIKKDNNIESLLRKTMNLLSKNMMMQKNYKIKLHNKK